MSNELRYADFGSIFSGYVRNSTQRHRVAYLTALVDISTKVESGFCTVLIYKRASERLDFVIPFPFACSGVQFDVVIVTIKISDKIFVSNLKSINAFLAFYRFNNNVCCFSRFFGGNKCASVVQSAVEVEHGAACCSGIHCNFVGACRRSIDHFREIFLRGGSIDSHFKLFGVGCFTTFDGGNEFYGLCFFLKFNNEFVVSDGNAGILFVESPRNNNVGISRALERKVIASVVTDKAHESESALFESNCVCIGKHRQLKIGKRSAADRSQIERSVIE